jgi:hypothetical protein
VRFRRLDSLDLAEAAADEGGRGLARRCVVEARRGEQLVDAADLPDEVFALLDERVAAADPFAEILLTLACEACGHAWQECLDIAAFFHAELAWAAGRLLDQVHLLARSYGWSQAEVLALGPRRRQAYLERILG